MDEIKDMILAANAQAKIVNELARIRDAKYHAWRESRHAWEQERAHWCRLMSEIEIQVRMASGGRKEEPSA